MKTVYTSAELLVNMLVQAKCPDVITHEIKTKCPLSGEVHLVTTDLVGRHSHFILKVMAERINKYYRRIESTAMNLIGDGIGQYTHTIAQAKGSNQYITKDLSAKVSDKNPIFLYELTQDLGLDSHTINKIACLDDAVQMIGRKGSWRAVRDGGKKAANTSMILFTSSRVGKYISDNCPYQMTTETYLTRQDEYDNCNPDFPDKKGTPKDLYMWLIMNVNRYIEYGCTDKSGGGTKAFLSDVTTALAKTKADQRLKFRDDIVEYFIVPRLDWLRDAAITSSSPARYTKRIKALRNLQSDIEEIDVVGLEGSV